MEIVGTFGSADKVQVSIIIDCNDSMALVRIQTRIVESNDIVSQEDMYCTKTELIALSCILQAVLVLLPHNNNGSYEQGSILATLTPFIDDAEIDVLPYFEVGSFYHDLVRLELKYEDDESDFYTSNSIAGVYIDLTESECRLLVNYLSDAVKLLE